MGKALSKCESRGRDARVVKPRSLVRSSAGGRDCRAGHPETGRGVWGELHAALQVLLPRGGSVHGYLAGGQFSCGLLGRSAWRCSRFTATRVGVNDPGLPGPPFADVGASPCGCPLQARTEPRWAGTGACPYDRSVSAVRKVSFRRGLRSKRERTLRPAVAGECTAQGMNERAMALSCLSILLFALWFSYVSAAALRSFIFRLRVLAAADSAARLRAVAAVRSRRGRHFADCAADGA